MEGAKPDDRPRADRHWLWRRGVCPVFAAQAAPVGSGNKEEGFQSSVPAAILLDADSDSILYEKNGDQPIEPASLAKLITLEFLFNEIKQGRVKPDDEYIISEKRAKGRGALTRHNYVGRHSQQGEGVGLLQGIIVDSAR